MNYELIPAVVAWLIVVSTLAVGLILGFRLAAGREGREPRSIEEGFSLDFFEQIRDAALVTENGVVVEANAAAHQQFGYKTLQGLPVANLLANSADEPRFVRALMEGPVTDYELRLRTSSGDILDCLITAEGRFDAEGNVIGCRGLARNVTERNRIMNELRRAEQDYRGLFEHAHDAILILDPVNETVLDANEQACILYDFPRESFIGRSMVELSVDPRRGRTLLRRTREGSGRYATFESKQFRRDGSSIDVEINAAEVSYRRRKVILSINRDITARRKAEKSVRESEERLRLMLESVTDYAIVMLDPIGRIVSWNEGAQRITGYSEAEVLGQSAAMFSPPDSPEKLVDLLSLAATTGRADRVAPRVRKDGSRFTASVTLTKIVDDDGVVRGYAEITHDITISEQLERTQQEMLAVLGNVAAEWTQTFDAVRVPIVMVDTAGEIRRLNGAALALVGLPFKGVIGRPVADIPGEPWRTIGIVAEDAFRHGRTRSARAQEGEAVWDVSASVATEEPGDLRAVVVAYDLTLVTQLEASLRRHEVAAMLGALVAGVAHEVRNPLFTISATLDAWEARYGATGGLERYAGVLREQVDRLNGLMRDLLEYGKPNPLVVHEASLGDIIRAAAADCATLAEQRGASIVFAIDDLPPTLLDAARMEQVFQNVIDNAVRHSSPGDTVRIEAHASGATIDCRVLDEGPGIGHDDPETMFEPFVTRRRGGTGLGLPIARRVVNAHGGQISLMNRDDHRGAVVAITLPWRDERSQSLLDSTDAELLIGEGVVH